MILAQDPDCFEILYCKMNMPNCRTRRSYFIVTVLSPLQLWRRHGETSIMQLNSMTGVAADAPDADARVSIRMKRRSLFAYVVWLQNFRFNILR